MTGLMETLVKRLAGMLPEPRVIYGRADEDPYLSRWYLLGTRREADPVIKGNLVDETKGVMQRLPVNVFLHRFHRSDDDGALHSHPWSWAISLVLVAGYSEERRLGDTVVRRRVRPLTLNFLRGDTYHRVDLIDGRESWSLFIVGPRHSSWYFWDRARKARCDWRDYITALRDSTPVPWEPDARETGGTG